MSSDSGGDAGSSSQEAANFDDYYSEPVDTGSVTAEIMVVLHKLLHLITKAKQQELVITLVLILMMVKEMIETHLIMRVQLMEQLQLQNLLMKFL